MRGPLWPGCCFICACVQYFAVLPYSFLSPYYHEPYALHMPTGQTIAALVQRLIAG